MSKTGRKRTTEWVAKHLLLRKYLPLVHEDLTAVYARDLRKWLLVAPVIGVGDFPISEAAVIPKSQSNKKGQFGVALEPEMIKICEQLCLRHHSMVELVNRLIDQDILRRRHEEQDHREVLVELTPHGEALQHRLSILHWEELRVSGPALAESLRAVVHHSGPDRRRQA